MTGKKWAFEDFVEGATIDLGTKLVTADEIIEFASEFDAQPMHLDEEAGKASILGGLSASGWHTCAMFMRMLCDAFLLDLDLSGFARHRLCQMEEAGAGRRPAFRRKMHRPRQAQSRSKPGARPGALRAEIANQRGEGVFEFENTCMFLMREPSAA